MARSVAAEQRRTARGRLDARREALLALVRAAAPPAGGWVGAVRSALGMSSLELGRRMGIDNSNVVRLEQSERAGGIRLDTLRRAADALECDLVYALVPRRPLAEMVDEQARRRASALVQQVDHSMRLEDQQVEPSAVEAQLQQLTDEFVDKPGLWRVS